MVDFCNAVANLCIVRDVLFCSFAKQVEKLEYRTKINHSLNVVRKMPLGFYCLLMLNSLRFAKNTFGKSLSVRIFQNSVQTNMLTVLFCSEVIATVDGTSV